MSRIIKAVLAPLSIAVLLAVVALAVLPQSSTAQPYCVACFGGLNFFEGDAECWDGQPEGSASCETGSYWTMQDGVWTEHSWCAEEGECQALMFLDFSEDGAPVGFAEESPPALNDAVWAETGRTCDGILLRDGVIKLRVARHEPAPILVL